MKLFAQRKTDIEYIETLRKQYKKRWIVFGFSVFLSIVLIVVVSFIGLRLDAKNKAFIETIANSKNPVEDEVKHDFVAIGKIMGFKTNTAHLTLEY
ncbi:MAG: hypothetical protein WCS27_14135 [Victivallaceae bacterium]